MNDTGLLTFSTLVGWLSLQKVVSLTLITKLFWQDQFLSLPHNWNYRHSGKLRALNKEKHEQTLFLKLEAAPYIACFPMFFSNNAIFKHINWHLQNTCTCNCRDWHNLSSRASSLDHHYHYQRQVKSRCHSKLHEEFICTNCFNRIYVQQNSNITNTGITN